MRVLHVLTQADDDGAYGGPLTVALAQCRAAVAAGHRAELAAGWVAPRAAPRELAGVPAHLFPARPLVRRAPFVTLWSTALAGFLRREVGAYDLVHVHLARDLVPTAAVVLAGRRGVPVVAQPHGMVAAHRRRAVRVLDALALRRVWRRTGRVLALTPDEARDLAALGMRGVVTLPNAGPPLPPTVPDRAARGREVVFLARLHPRKRVLDVTATARVLAARGVAASFTVCGPDGGDLPALRAEIARDGLVRYEGPVDRAEVLVRLGRAAVCLAPARDEPFGLALLEAMAAGTPTVSVRPGGLADRIEAAGAGVVVGPDPAAMADAVAALLDDDARWADVSARGRAFAAGFAPAAAGDTLLAVYAELVESRPRR